MPVRVSGVYTIKNAANNKTYVGSSVDFKARIRQHKKQLDKNKHHNVHLQRAWEKYGKNFFIFSLVEECDVSLLLEREQHWIDFFETTNRKKGYNICPNAGSCLGCKRTDEVRKNMSKGKIGRPGPKHSQKTKNLLHDMRCGEKNPFYGKKHTDETKKKISEYGKRKRCGRDNPMSNPEYVEKMKKTMLSVSYRWSGDNNPSKRPDVREKIRLSKLGTKKVLDKDGKFHYEKGMNKTL